MFISCACGEKIHDNTDFMSWKAHLLPDQQWEELFDIVDSALETPDKAARREEIQVQVRNKIHKLFRSAWECVACSRLYIENKGGELLCYAPQGSDAPQYILSGEKPRQKEEIQLTVKRWWKLW
jgi:hypothetical protein